MSPVVAMAAPYNKNSEGLGFNRRGAERELLSSTHDLLSHLSSSAKTKQIVQNCFSMEYNRLRARQTGVNLALISASLGQAWDTVGWEDAQQKKQRTAQGSRLVKEKERNKSTLEVGLPRI